MTKVIGVRFRQAGKVYYFAPGKFSPAQGEAVIVETARGVECGEIAMDNRNVNDDEIVKPLKKLLRIATEDDLKKVEENKEKDVF